MSGSSQLCLDQPTRADGAAMGGDGWGNLLWSPVISMAMGVGGVLNLIT